MNRHGISQNPTAEESALLRKLWAADDARHRTRSLAHENERLRLENDRLRAALAAPLPDDERPPEDGVAAAIDTLYDRPVSGAEERLRAALERELNSPWTGIRTTAAQGLFDKAKASRTQEVTIAAQQLAVLLPAIESSAVFIALRRLLSGGSVDEEGG
jgi:hypothetical protein